MHTHVTQISCACCHIKWHLSHDLLMKNVIVKRSINMSPIVAGLSQHCHIVVATLLQPG